MVRARCPRRLTSAVKALGESPESLVELEEAYFSIKLKAVTVYLGSLLRAP